MTERIEAQVERFAPGFRDRILARSARGRPTLEADNAELRRRRHQRRAAGLRQLFTRPVARLDPYATPARGHLPLLVVDAAGRWRPRHVRRLGGPICAPS